MNAPTDIATAATPVQAAATPAPATEITPAPAPASAVTPAPTPVTAAIPAPATAAADSAEAERRATAARIFEVMRHLVLERGDRRAEVSEALGMSFGRIKALRRLVAGPLRMSELTAKLLTDKPYTTLMVDDLERRGLVERSVHPEDRRCKIVTLTAAGLAAAGLADAILARTPESMLALEPEELAELDRLVAKL
jgi:DNA-binding MarR family transcriptional regulator